MKFPRRNFAYSGIRLVANQILPLAALPFLLSQLGESNFGMVVFSQAVAMFGIVFVEYGFNLTAVREVSIGRHNLGVLRTVFYEVTTARVLLYVASVLAVIGFSLTIHGELTGATLHVLVAMVAALGAAIQPVWFLQGLEEFGVMSLVQVLSRAACFGVLFVAVDDPSDSYLAQFLMALPFCVGAAVLLPRVFCRLRGERPSARGLLRGACSRVRAGKDVFVGQMSTTLFSSTTTVVCGAVMGATVAGYYGLAERMIRGLAMMTTPITEALYPRLSAAFSSSCERESAEAFRLLRRVLLAGSLLFGVAGVCVVVSAGTVAKILTQTADGSEMVSLTLSILAFAPLMIFLNNMFGVQILLGHGLGKLYRNSVLMAGLSIPVLGVILPRLFGFAGYPSALLAGEAALVLITFIYARRYAKWGSSRAS